MKFRIAGLLLSIFLSLATGGCELFRAIDRNLQPPPSPGTTPEVSESPVTPVSPSPAGRAAVLSGLSEGSQINIRSQPNMQAAVIYYGTVGDRVHVTQQQQDSNRKTWYYVTFDDANAKGWVHGTLIRFLDSASTPAPDTNTPIDTDTALRRCRSQADAELPGTRIQVSQGWLNPDGSYVINWSASNGAYGACTVDANGWVVSFANTYEQDGPPSYSITPAALRGCENRVARELGLSLYDINVQEASAYRDGTFGVNWWTVTRQSGFCRVTRNGSVLSFITNDQPSARQIALDRCRDRVRRAYPDTRIEVSLDPREHSRNYKVIWSTNTGEEGYCRVNQNGNLYEFVDYSKGNGNTGETRCFGNIFSDTAFTVLARDSQFRRAEFRNRQTGYRSIAYLSTAGATEQGQPIYRGRLTGFPAAEITVIDRSGGNPGPGTEISLAYDREWAKGRCR
jgi:hypothetical protein